jgi:hypothetical protein
MTSPLRRAWVVAFAIAAAPGCNCSERRIDVTLPGTIEMAGLPPAITFTGGVSDSSAGGSYALLERVVTDASASGGATQAHTIMWTMRESSGGAPAAFLSFALRVPVATGDTVTVSVGSSGGGWGVLTGDPRPTPLTANAYFEKGSFVPATARGTLRVLRTAPLQLEVDVVFLSSGQAVRLVGTMSFATSEFETACFS